MHLYRYPPKELFILAAEVRAETAIQKWQIVPLLTRELLFRKASVSVGGGQVYDAAQRDIQLHQTCCCTDETSQTSPDLLGEKTPMGGNKYWQ